MLTNRCYALPSLGFLVSLISGADCVQISANINEHLLTYIIAMFLVGYENAPLPLRGHTAVTCARPVRLPR